MKTFLAKHSVRLVGFLAALAPILISRWPGVPWEALTGVAAGFLGVGEVAQRKADAKTAAGWLAAEATQAALAELEKAHANPAADTPDVAAMAVAAPTPVAPTAE